MREVFAVQGAVAVLLAGWREDDVALCEVVPFLLGFNKALALGHEQNLIAAMDVHSGVGSVIEVDYVDAHLLALVREALARNVFGTVEEFGCAAHALARYFRQLCDLHRAHPLMRSRDGIVNQLACGRGLFQGAQSDPAQARLAIIQPALRNARDSRCQSG